MMGAHQVWGQPGGVSVGGWPPGPTSCCSKGMLMGGAGQGEGLQANGGRSGQMVG